MNIGSPMFSNLKKDVDIFSHQIEKQKKRALSFINHVVKKSFYLFWRELKMYSNRHLGQVYLTTKMHVLLALMLFIYV